MTNPKPDYGGKRLKPEQWNPDASYSPKPKRTLPMLDFESVIGGVCFVSLAAASWTYIITALLGCS